MYVGIEFSLKLYTKQQQQKQQKQRTHYTYIRFHLMLIGDDDDEYLVPT